MPVILTEKYAHSRFFVPYKADKSEGVWVTPLTETDRRLIRDAALQEAGHDADLAMSFTVRDTLKKCVKDWIGFRDAAGRDIPFDAEALPMLVRLDPDFFQALYVRVVGVARFGELADLKN